jgi:N-acetylneuraminic acid mutarotase
MKHRNNEIQNYFFNELLCNKYGATNKWQNENHLAWMTQRLIPL